MVKPTNARTLTTLPWLGAAQCEGRLAHGDLLPQRQVFQREFSLRADRRTQCPQDDPKPSDHDRPIMNQSANRQTFAPDTFLGRTGRNVRVRRIGF